MRDAVASDPEHRMAWFWRVQWASLLHGQMIATKDPAERQRLKREAETLLKEALKGQPPPADAKRIRDILNRWSLEK
jgi:hypothetical protein